VVAGQRLPKDRETSQALIESIAAKYPDRATDLRAAFKKDTAVPKKGPRLPSLCSPKEIETLLEELQRLANIIARICESAADRQMEIIQRRFSAYWMNQLAEFGPSSPTIWQSRIKTCLSSLCEFLDPVERIGLFHGYTSAGSKENVIYSLFSMNSPKWWRSERFSRPADKGDSFDYFPPGKMPSDVVSAIGPNLAKKKHFYLYSHAEQFEPQYAAEQFAIVLLQTRAKMDEEMDEFCRGFCSGLCSRDALTRLFQRQVHVHRRFRRHVIDIRHDLNTSMHYLTGNVDKLVRELQEGITLDTDQGRDNWDLVRESIRSYKKTVFKLEAPDFADVSQAVETVDVFDLVHQLVAFCEVTAAEEKNISISTQDLPSDGALILCDSGELSQALMNILDNAIKYSYSGWKGGRDVVVSGAVENDRAELTFVNYGIGIPPEMLTKIKNYKHRAHVPDKRRFRTGEGRGLSIATEIIEKRLGGKIDISSHKPESRFFAQEQVKKYHRYLTTVTVGLPIHTWE
jgi:signal transduction histidine kinase